MHDRYDCLIEILKIVSTDAKFIALKLTQSSMQGLKIIHFRSSLNILCKIILWNQIVFPKWLESNKWFDICNDVVESVNQPRKMFT